MIVTYSTETIEDIISGVAGEHITSHGAEYTVTMTDSGVLITVHLGKWSTSQFTRLRGLPSHVQNEVVHCAAHTVAMHLLTHLYPA